ncbi:Uncharacterized protein FWK35_00000984 [Aphis craccivora]|uniref:Uncharacterized protein n=1 Tax=Aphis craccivora TaxID=307492 RepID=A0A6G0ZK71_APHCR|nr:Uncharacterized protein FWK35_00000984 [Aphis craccivora]
MLLLHIGTRHFLKTNPPITHAKLITHAVEICRQFCQLKNDSSLRGIYDLAKIICLFMFGHKITLLSYSPITLICRIFDGIRCEILENMFDYLYCLLITLQLCLKGFVKQFEENVLFTDGSILNYKLKVKVGSESRFTVEQQINTAKLIRLKTTKRKNDKQKFMTQKHKP